MTPTTSTTTQTESAPRRNQRNIITHCTRLERKLERQLNESWSSGLHHLPEERAVDIPIDGRRPEELRVIESIESLHAELKVPALPEPEILEQGEIGVERSGTIKRAAGSIAGRAQRAHRERGGIEIGQPVAWIAVQVQGQTDIVGRVEAIVIHALRAAALQGIVFEALERYREPGRGASDTGNSPSLCENRPLLGEQIEGKIDLIAGDKVVLQVPGRNGARGFVVEGIHGFAESRSLVDRFAVGVADQEEVSLAGVAERRLQRVVARIAEGAFEVVVAKDRPKGPAGAVNYLAALGYVGCILTVRTAGGGVGGQIVAIAEEEAESRVSWIDRIGEKKMMRLRADVGYAQHGVLGQLALDGEEVVFAIGERVLRIGPGGPRDRQEWGEVLR